MSVDDRCGKRRPAIMLGRFGHRYVVHGITTSQRQEDALAFVIQPGSKEAAQMRINLSSKSRAGLPSFVYLERSQIMATRQLHPLTCGCGCRKGRVPGRLLDMLVDFWQQAPSRYVLVS